MCYTRLGCVVHKYITYVLHTVSSLLQHTVIGYFESFIDGDVVGKFEILFLGCLLVAVVGHVLGFNEVNELGLWDGKVLGITLGALVGI